jgi:hypothetical protein
MEAARAVIARLDRIDRLERAGAPAESLLHEVRALLLEAERWTRSERERPRAALEALSECRRALECREQAHDRLPFGTLRAR